MTCGQYGPLKTKAKLPHYLVAPGERLESSGAVWLAGRCCTEKAGASEGEPQRQSALLRIPAVQPKQVAGLASLNARNGNPTMSFKGHFTVTNAQGLFRVAA